MAIGKSNLDEHAWLTQGDLIIDITADQYGDSCVATGHITEKKYKENLSEIEVVERLEKLSKRASAWFKGGSKTRGMQ